MTTCKIPLPGNIECQSHSMYVVTTPTSDGGFFHRFVCSFHLVQAINLDMKLKSGVRVSMAMDAFR